MSILKFSNKSGDKSVCSKCGQKIKYCASEKKDKFLDGRLGDGSWVHLQGVDSGKTTCVQSRCFSCKNEWSDNGALADSKEHRCPGCNGDVYAVIGPAKPIDRNLAQFVEAIKDWWTWEISWRGYRYWPGVRWLLGSNGIYYTKIRTIFKKYNIIKIRSLEPTWQDRTEVLPHAMFQVLVDFVEEERPEMMKEDWPTEFESWAVPNYTPKEDFDALSKADPDGRFASLRHQFASDQKIRNLYKWWLAFLKRESPWSEGYPDNWESLSRAEQSKYLEASDKKEARQEKELEAAMFKLVKLRGRLWT